MNELLDDIAFGEKPAPVMANRVLALASVMMNYAVESGSYGVTVNPCYRVKKRVQEKGRTRVLDEDEIR